MSIKNLLSRITKVQNREAARLSAGALRMLVTTLAKRDAIFWPWRHHGDFRGAVRDIQRQVIAGKYGIAARGAGLEQWKSASDERAELQAAGLAIAVTAKSQTTGLILTPQGEADARALAGERSDIQGVVALMQSRQADWRNGWCSESVLFGKELVGEACDWDDLTGLTLPALCSGNMESNCDMRHRVYYRLVHDRVPETITSEMKAEQWAVDDYFDAYRTERRLLQSLECSTGEIVIPMAAS